MVARSHTAAIRHLKLDEPIPVPGTLLFAWKFLLGCPAVKVVPPFASGLVRRAGGAGSAGAPARLRHGRKRGMGWPSHRGERLLVPTRGRGIARVQALELRLRRASVSRALSSLGDGEQTPRELVLGAAGEPRPCGKVGGGERRRGCGSPGNCCGGVEGLRFPVAGQKWPRWGRN